MPDGDIQLTKNQIAEEQNHWKLRRTESANTEGIMETISMTVLTFCFEWNPPQNYDCMTINSTCFSHFPQSTFY